jgi:hypothetical protein
MFNLNGSPSLLELGSTYALTLTISNAATGAHGAVSLHIRANIPPSPGLCTGHPVIGRHLTDTFNLACTDWIDDDLPLQYVFFTAPGAAGGSSVYPNSTAAGVSFTPPGFSSTHGERASRVAIQVLTFLLVHDLTAAAHTRS